MKIYKSPFVLIAVVIVVIIIIFAKRRESYKLLGNLGMFNHRPKGIGFLDDDNHSSVKYRGHRYDRRKVRYHI